MTRGYDFPPSTKARVIAEFKETWTAYRSPTAAATAIGKMYGVSKTTVFTWVDNAGAWPVTRASRVLELQAQLLRLQEENAVLRGSLVAESD